jgi:hypothetical protein
MNAKQISSILVENEFKPFDARRIGNLLHNHMVDENTINENKQQYIYDVEATLKEISNEVFQAKKMFPKNFVNQHEGYAVILEEVEELWAEIKQHQLQYNLKTQKKEAIQAAAMLVRFIVELTNPETK